MTDQPRRRDRLQVIFAFLVFFGMALFLVRPEYTRAQLLFRAAIVLTGVIGLVWLNTRRHR